MRSYLSKCVQTIKVEQEYSNWKKIKHSITQGSILGPIFFNINLCGIFFIVKNVDIVSFADDSILDMLANIINVVEKLGYSGSSFFKWLANNRMQKNANKFHALLSTVEKVITKINWAEVENNRSEKILGVIIDSQLSLEIHINKMCSKATSEFSGLSRVAAFMNFNQEKC